MLFSRYALAVPAAAVLANGQIISDITSAFGDVRGNPYLQTLHVANVLQGNL